MSKYPIHDQDYRLSGMIALVSAMFADKYDKGGKPYVMHCLHVMHAVEAAHGYDPELLQIAVGHDLIEDTCVTAQDLWEWGYSQRVIDGIVAISKKNGQSYEEYKTEVKNNYDTVRVKMQDLKHNSCLDRLKGVTEKDIARTVRYMNFYQELKQKSK